LTSTFKTAPSFKNGKARRGGSWPSTLGRTTLVGSGGRLFGARGGLLRRLRSCLRLGRRLRLRCRLRLHGHRRFGGVPLQPKLLEAGRLLVASLRFRGYDPDRRTLHGTVRGTGKDGFGTLARPSGVVHSMDLLVRLVS